MKLKLIEPTTDHKDEAIAFMKEFAQENARANGSNGLDKYLDDYSGWLEKINDFVNPIKNGKAPSSTYFVVNTDNYIVGVVNIRHSLINDFLFNCGGHVGYCIRLSERRKGYAGSALKLALEKCKALGIEKALLTCDKDNIASSKTILKNGGILENEVQSCDYADVVQRYWIEID